ncbi:MAG: enoyl-CoA hydratase/isomerase family protein, partial [Candidatus Dormibacteria bacterium]
LATRLAEQAPLAVAAIKRAVTIGLEAPLEVALEAELEQFDATFRTEDARAGIEAFLEKRRPNWTAR